jgi:hypothetical protein
VIVFGLLLLGISRGKAATKPTTRYALYTLSGLCGILVIAVAGIGIYAMTQKPSSARPKPKAAAATLAPAGATEPQGFRATSPSATTTLVAQAPSARRREHAPTKRAKTLATAPATYRPFWPMTHRPLRP